MKSNLVYLLHIRDACLRIETYIDGKTFSEFRRTQLLQDGVVRQIQIIGQAAKQLTPELRKKLKAIDWIGIIGMRNKLVHEYFGVDLKTIWVTAAEEVPQLLKELEKYRNR
jgi:uncharacterized protein with HEPN domain